MTLRLTLAMSITSALGPLIPGTLATLTGWSAYRSRHANARRRGRSSSTSSYLVMSTRRYFARQASLSPHPLKERIPRPLHRALNDPYLISGNNVHNRPSTPTHCTAPHLAGTVPGLYIHLLLSARRRFCSSLNCMSLPPSLLWRPLLLYDEDFDATTRRAIIVDLRNDSVPILNPRD